MEINLDLYQYKLEELTRDYHDIVEEMVELWYEFNMDKDCLATLLDEESRPVGVADLLLTKLGDEIQYMCANHTDNLFKK